MLKNALRSDTLKQLAFPVAQMVKNMPAVQTWVWSLSQKDPLENRMATHSSILAWRIPWTEETDSPWGHKESDMTEQLTLSLQVIGN